MRSSFYWRLSNCRHWTDEWATPAHCSSAWRRPHSGHRRGRARGGCGRDWDGGRGWRQSHRLDRLVLVCSMPKSYQALVPCAVRTDYRMPGCFVTLYFSRLDWGGVTSASDCLSESWGQQRDEDRARHLSRKHMLSQCGQGICSCIRKLLRLQQFSPANSNRKYSQWSSTWTVP